MFSQMSIKKKLMLSGVVCSILSILIATVAYRGLSRVDGTLNEVLLNSQMLNNHQHADMMHDALRGDVYGAVLAASQNATAAAERLKGDAREHAAEFRKMLAENKTVMGDGPVKGKLGAAEQEAEKYIEMAETLVAQAFTDHASAMKQLEAFNAEFAKLEDLMGKVSDFIETENSKARKTGGEIASSAVKNVVVVSLISLIAIAFVSFVFPRQIVVALDKIHHMGETIAEASAAGNLTVRADASSNDEVGALAGHINKVLDNFRAALLEIRDASDRLVNASGEVAAVSRETSAGVQRQQSETEQVATAVNEMTATVQEIARNSVQTAQSAGQGNQEAGNTRKIVAEAIESMDVLSQQVNRTVDVLQKLKADSGSIGVVLDVIRSIAEQTNLLALNAAIEAARAGEQGRGFAVVADEVRTLAQRTQQSTREIQDMIQRLQAGVGEVASTMEQGQQQTRATVEKVSEAGTSLQGITSAVGVITEMSAQIATATEEQSKTSEEINRNIANISSVADQTSSAAQRAASATEDIAELSRNLRALVQRFRLG